MTGIARDQSPPSPPPAETPPRDPSPGDPVRQLERAFQARRSDRRWRALAGLALIGVGIGGYQLWTHEAAPEAKSPFTTSPVGRRDIVETVESSGKLKPVTEVQVGSQVSGRVVKVHVDFNSKVENGQLLAEIDPSLFGAQVSQVTGQLEAAKAQLERAQATRQATRQILRRTEQLNREGIASQAELDQARSGAELAEADVVAANATIRGLTAQLRSANTTLAYTRIYSPIDGVVINRAVDPGQTVASSFSAPVLFVIAQDLSEMQVLADIDEADVGKLKEGMKTRVSVDAFPGEHFEGVVTQLRYSPNDVQGVVTYGAVVDVPNPELKLRPGMTATVSITAQKATQALAVKNAALRFKPADASKAGRSLELDFGERRVFTLAPNPSSAPGAPPPSPRSDQGGPPPGAKGKNAPDAEGGEAAPVLQPHRVRVGITDGVWTEIRGESLKEGTAVVTQQRNAKKGQRRRKFLGIF